MRMKNLLTNLAKSSDSSVVANANHLVGWTHQTSAVGVTRIARTLSRLALIANPTHWTYATVFDFVVADSAIEATQSTAIGSTIRTFV